MKNMNIVSNKIVEERVREYCRKIEENKLKNVKATIKIDRTKININNRKKLYSEKLRNEEIERNNNILKKKLEGINKREKKTIEQIKQISLQKMNTNKKNFLFENIKRAKVKKENKKINHVNDIPIKNLKKKIVYKGYIDDSEKNDKFYTELKVDENSNLNILALNLKNKKVKKLLYNKEKHNELLNKLNSYEEIAKNINLDDEENADEVKKLILNKKKNEKREITKPLRIKHRIMLENIEKTCDFYIKKYFSDELEDINSTTEADKIDGSNTSQNNDLMNLKKKKNSFLLMKNEILYKSKINEAQALLIFQKIKEKLKKNPSFLKSNTNFGSIITENNKKNIKNFNLIQNQASKIKKDMNSQRNVSKYGNIKNSELKKKNTKQNNKGKYPEKEYEKNLEKNNLDKDYLKKDVETDKIEKEIEAKKVENNSDKSNLEKDKIEEDLEKDKVEDDLEIDKVEADLEIDKVEADLEIDKVETELEKNEVDKELKNGNIDNDLEKNEVDKDLEKDKVEDDLEIDKVEADLEIDKVETELEKNEVDKELKNGNIDNDLEKNEVDKDLEKDKVEDDLEIDKVEADLEIDKVETELEKNEVDKDLEKDEVDKDLEKDKVEDDLEIDKVETELEKDEVDKKLKNDKIET